MAFDAVLLVSFGGPEGPDEVEPFLENVLRGRQVPRERMQQVAAHYLEFGGVSPISGQNRALVEALRAALDTRAADLPVYWGNRNWHPFLADTMRTMRADGIRRAAAFVTSAYSSYSSCRQYLDDLAQARLAVGEGAPEVVKLRPYSRLCRAPCRRTAGGARPGWPRCAGADERAQYPGCDGRDL